MGARPGKSLRGGAVLHLAALLAVLLWIPVATGLRFQAKRDEGTYHLPLVQEMARRAPTPDDLRDPAVEMGPFFHVVLGGAARLTGTQPAALRAWMTAAGLASVALFAFLARRAGRADWRESTLLLAAFPYFGACYFTVMTDYGAFLPMLAAWLAQLRYVETGSRRALWTASGAALVACLTRQSLVFVPLAFAASAGLRHVSRGRDDARALDPGTVLALALPFAAIAVRLGLWGGIIPPGTTREDGFLGLDAAYQIPGGYPAHYLLAVGSMAANIGYYLLPATLALAVTGGWSRRRWMGLLGGAAVATLCLRMIRGRELVSTYGTFLHVLTELRLRIGEPAAQLVVLGALASFAVLAGAVWERVRSPAPERERMRVLAWLLVLGLLTLAFGKFRVFERYVLPLHALAILFLSDAAARRRSGLVRAGMIAAVLFGIAHGIVYGWEVYGLGG